MGQVIPIKTRNRVHRARRFAAVHKHVAPVCAGAARLIGRLLLDTAWFFIGGGLRVFGRCVRFALTCAFWGAVLALGLEFYQRWLHPMHAIIAAIAAIATLGLRDVLYRLECRARDYPPLWR